MVDLQKIGSSHSLHLLHQHRAHAKSLDTLSDCITTCVAQFMILYWRVWEATKPWILIYSREIGMEKCSQQTRSEQWSQLQLQLGASLFNAKQTGSVSANDKQTSEFSVHGPKFNVDAALGPRDHHSSVPLTLTLGDEASLRLYFLLHLQVTRRVTLRFDFGGRDMVEL